MAVLEQGDKIHVMTRRRFEEDLRRHFVGEIQAATDTAIRVEGYTFVFDGTANEFVKRPEIRVRIFGLADSGNIINVLPRTVDIKKVYYGQSEDKRLMLADGESFTLDINEFTHLR
ncbi:MAG: hypothetical protein WBC88_00565 [Candidatus Zixiibacteriota bacterium]